MKIFFAASESRVKNQKNDKVFYHEEYYNRTGIKINILISFYYMQGDIEEEIRKHKIFSDNIMLDSGAFSLFKKKEEIDKLVPMFVNTVKYNKEFFEEFLYCVFSMDLREDVDGFTENYNQYMNLVQFFPRIVPVIHSLYTHPNDEIRAYSYFNPPIIGIGKIKGKKAQVNREALITSINSIRKNSKCHLLAITDYDTIKELPKFDTCDSRSWLEYANNGFVFYNYLTEDGAYKEVLIYFNKYHISEYERYNNSKVIPYTQMQMTDCERWEKFLSEINNLQIMCNDLLDAVKGGFYRSLCNIYYYLKMEEYINKTLHK